MSLTFESAWKPNDELGASVNFAGNRNRSAVRLNHGFYHAQPQAEAALRAALVPAIEPLPNLVPLLFGNPHSRILEDNDRLPLLTSNADRHPPLIRGIFDRIV